MTLALALTLAIASGSRSAPAPAPIIEALLGWAIEARELPSDPPMTPPVLPHRDCGGRLDPARPPATVYVSWDLSAEAQHTACNWKYDVASRRASPLTPAEAAEISQRVAAGTIAPHERAFFHSKARRDGLFDVTVGYCWGSAKGTIAMRADGPVLIGELAVHGY